MTKYFFGENFTTLLLRSPHFYICTLCLKELWMISTAQCGNCCECDLCKYQINVFTKEVDKELISWKCLSVIAFYTVQCFKSRHDNFSSNYLISKGQFQTLFSQLLVDPIFLHSYGGQYMSSILPPISFQLWNQWGAEKSASEFFPNLNVNCRL